MSAEEHRIYIGTTGWNHANWKDSFYPDDLPDEWALTYYSNEIPVVYLPQSLNWDQMVGELLENSNDKFRFLLGLEIDATLLSPQLLDAIEQLSDRLLGLVLRLNPEQVSPEQFEAVLDQLQGYRVVLDTGSQMNSVSALDTSWQGCLRKHHIELSVYEKTRQWKVSKGSWAWYSWRMNMSRVVCVTSLSPV